MGDEGKSDLRGKLPVSSVELGATKRLIKEAKPPRYADLKKIEEAMDLIRREELTDENLQLVLLAFREKYGEILDEVRSRKGSSVAPRDENKERREKKS